MQKDPRPHAASDKSTSQTHRQYFDYGSLYPPMFPLSPSLSPSDASVVEDDLATENRLSQASLALENQQLYNRYAMCLSHLRDSLQQLSVLRESYDSVRMANADLVRRMSLMSQAFGQNCFVDDFNRLSLEEGARNSPTSVIDERGHFGQQRNGKERVALPKSISVRSSGYTPPHRGGFSGVPRRGHRVNSVKAPPTGVSGSQRVCVPGSVGEQNQSAVEFDVFNQGMLKTELCNKWQETGACPYGENCQFAHGITELRPVIRHPRYKTEVCRMLLAGDNCPYGHRCHFRHSLTPEEKMLGPLRLNERNG